MKTINETKKQYIFQAIEKITSITEEQLKIKTRKRNTVDIRYIAMYLMQKYTTLSAHDIGAVFNFKSHCNTLHAVKVIEDLLITNKDIKLAVNDIESELISMINLSNLYNTDLLPEKEQIDEYILHAQKYISALSLYKNRL